MCIRDRDIGVRNIQLAGYDVYYEEKTPETRARFIRNLRQACTWAEETQVILSIEIMDDPFINSIEKYLAVEKAVSYTHLDVYKRQRKMCGLEKARNFPI